MAILYRYSSVPFEGDIIKEVKFSYGDATITFESGKKITIHCHSIKENEKEEVSEDNEETYHNSLKQLKRSNKLRKLDIDGK